MNKYKNQEVTTLQLMFTTHKFENGKCSKCNFLLTDSQKLQGQINPGAPTMFMTFCDDIKHIEQNKGYQNPPAMVPDMVPEFREFRRPRKTLLKFPGGKYIKIVNPTTYELTGDIKKATIFATDEDKNKWKVTISKIWGTRLNDIDI